MKPFVIFGLLVLLGCEAPMSPSPIAQPPLESEPVPPQPILGDYFFSFDALDTYRTDHGFDSVVDSLGETVPGRELLGDVLLGDWPSDLSDTATIGKLERIGYRYSKTPQDKLSGIAELFREKTPLNSISAACIAEYKDVLVFRSKGEIVGVAKICFGCLQHRIVGTDADTQYFGQDGDYDRLSNMLASSRS